MFQVYDIVSLGPDVIPERIADKQVKRSSILIMNSFILMAVVMLCCAKASSQKCTPSAYPPDPKGDCCGFASSTKIIPGFFANLGEYPWMGIIEYQKENKTKLLCSAILISGRYALSAGQCFSADATRFGTAVSVRLGEHDTSNAGMDCDVLYDDTECNDGAISIPIEKVIVHPEYHINNSYQNDIALIRLATMAPHTDFINPICLPTSDVTVNPPTRLMMSVAGWGAINTTTSATDVLHHVTVPFVDMKTCQAAYTARKGPKLGSGQLCAGGKNLDACKGDSGGPLMHRNGRITEVAGIVSFGPVPCGMDGVPGVYTKVVAYDAWIRANIQE